MQSQLSTCWSSTFLRFSNIRFLISSNAVDSLVEAYAVVVFLLLLKERKLFSVASPLV